MQEFLENHFNNMAEENYSDISDGKSSLYVNVVKPQLSLCLRDYLNRYSSIRNILPNYRGPKIIVKRCPLKSCFT